MAEINCHKQVCEGGLRELWQWIEHNYSHTGNGHIKVIEVIMKLKI